MAPDVALGIGVDLDASPAVPGRMWSSWVSLKFAVTQMSSGTNIVELGAGLRVLRRRAAESLTTRPGCAAVTVV